MKHRLIAKTWLKDFKENFDVNHIDGNKLNNNISNLESISHTDNMKHASKYNLLKNQHNIDIVDKNNVLIKSFVSIKELSKYLGLAQTVILPFIKYSNVHFLTPGFSIRLKNKNNLLSSTNSGKKPLKFYGYDVINKTYITFDTLMECAYETCLSIPYLSTNINKNKFIYHKHSGYILSLTSIKELDLNITTFKNIQKDRDNFIKNKYLDFNRFIQKRKNNFIIY